MKKSTAIVLIALALFATGFILGAHPLVDHFGQTAESGAGTFGSQWIHTDTSGVRYGLWGQTESTSGRGVQGGALATSGQAYGVFGNSASPSGVGVFGNNTASTGGATGVRGESNASGPNSTGVSGWNGHTTGNTRGVAGGVRSSNGLGIYGYVDGSTTGSNTPSGVYGINLPSTGTGRGITGYNLADNGWAGSFDAVDGNGVRISSPAGSTGLVVTGGSKNAAVRTSDGDRLLYSEESTEVWFTDYGSGILRNGVATITIDQTFAETVNLEEAYHVFLQAYGDAIIYVSERKPTSFEVLAREGTSAADVEFAYRIVAKRKGFERQRLEFAPWVSAEAPYLVTPTPVVPPPDPTPIPEMRNAQSTSP